MSKQRQDLCVRIPDAPLITIHGAFSTEVRKGILYVYDRKGCLLAQFVRGTWLYAYAQEQVVQR